MTTNAPDAEPLLLAQSVSKAFAGVRALSDVSFDLRQGEVHALLGENGAGKSTLIKVVSGAITADSGVVLLNGDRFRPRNPDESARAGVGVVFQELPLVPDLTVMENIFFNNQPLTPLRTVARRRMRARSDALFESLGLKGIDPRRTVRSLSVAARQFVAIAKVLSTDPMVVVLDEATSALGPSEVEWLFERVQALAAAGKGVIFISHRLAEVEEISTRISVLRNGQNVGTWDRSAVDADHLISAMLGRQLEQLYPPRKDSVRPEPLLVVRGLAAGARLRGVELDVNAGEIVGVGGLEGQGQLELFLSLYGVIRSSGAILVDGKRRRIHTPRDALRAGIGLALVPEDRKNEGILPTLSVRENLSLPNLGSIARLGIIHRTTELGFVAPAMSDLNIGSGDPEQPVGSLSGGNQQKVVVGKFLLTGARILLLYDLTRGVDVGAKAEIFRMMEDLAAQGYAMLFYSSDLDELSNVAHRVLTMFDGVVSGDFPAGTFTQEDLVAAMVGRAGTRSDRTLGAAGADATAHVVSSGDEDRPSMIGQR